MAESHHVRNLLNRVRAGAAVARVNWPGRVSILEVSEAARHLVRIASSTRTVRETFFLAEDQPISIGDLFSAMGRTVGEPNAGSINVPQWVWSLSRIALPIAPFQLKCLLSDALVVSTKRARGLGIAVAAGGNEFLVPLARYNANQLFPSRHREPVLVTGAASGIGACLARQLYTSGYQLLLADRNEAPLQERCRAFPSAKSWVVDLANPSLGQILSSIFPAELPWPAVVINNAGVGWRGDSWDAAASTAQTVIGVNATAPTVISNFFLHESPAPITVVNIASTAAFQPLPYMAAYAAAKSYVLSFSLALEAELRATARRDRVLTVVPAGTKTAFQSAAGVATNAHEKLLSPDQVAAAIVQALHGSKSLLMIGGRGRAMSLAASVIPLRFQAPLWQRLMRTLR